jgi:hypothetical protein
VSHRTRNSGVRLHVAIVQTIGTVNLPAIACVAGRSCTNTAFVRDRSQLLTEIWKDQEPKGALQFWGKPTSVLKRDSGCSCSFVANT